MRDKHTELLNGLKGLNFVLILVESEDRRGSQSEKRQIILWWFSTVSMDDVIPN